ncbi:MAG: glycosyltransferase family 4 protein [Kofleriaceae bacterium]|nr:glycosyltransferase family 4 protein [Kofleriaceae bacterium]
MGAAALVGHAARGAGAAEVLARVKLGVLTTSYPRWAGDPAGNFVAAHVAALRELGHDVEVIAAGESRSDQYSLVRIPSRLFFRGGAPDALEHHPLRTLGGALAFSTRFAAAVATRAARWDSIVAHWLVPSAIAALPTRVPLLAIAHGGDVHTLRRMRLLAPVLHALHARRAELVFVSAALRGIAIHEVPSLAGWLAGARVQPMGIDVARFAALRRTPTDPPTVAIAARLVPLKGVDVAIAALAHLHAPVRLVIAGDGPERRRLEERAARLARSVEFLGAVDLETRDRLLASASCVVVPSRVTSTGRTEGTPLIALEALAAGVPVVASAVGGMPALAPAARLVGPDDPRGLAASIEAVLVSPPLSSELAAVVAHLDWRAIAPHLVRSA